MAGRTRRAMHPLPEKVFQRRKELWSEGREDPNKKSRDSKKHCAKQCEITPRFVSKAQVSDQREYDQSSRSNRGSHGDQNIWSHNSASAQRECQHFKSIAHERDEPAC